MQSAEIENSTKIPIDSKVCLNAKEAAELIGVSLPLMYQLMKNRDFPLIKLGRRNLIPRGSLETWLEQQAAAGSMFRGVKK